MTLEFYLSHGARTAADPSVIQLSHVLRQVPMRPEEPRVEPFRNTNAIALKLANFQALDPKYHGAGMQHGAKLDALLWERFSSKPEE